ncbi:hypothetical protein GS539_21525 [Rhodococcus hoagii]|nr:hypothetical protein [Prescottella equi]
MCTEGGRSVVDDGSLYLLRTTEPHMQLDRRHGTVRVDHHRIPSGCSTTRAD